jgi:hypothetical protein
VLSHLPSCRYPCFLSGHCAYQICATFFNCCLAFWAPPAEPESHTTIGMDDKRRHEKGRPDLGRLIKTVSGGQGRSCRNWFRGRGVGPSGHAQVIISVETYFVRKPPAQESSFEYLIACGLHKTDVILPLITEAPSLGPRTHAFLRPSRS